MDIIDGNSLWHITQKFGRVEFVVGARCLDNHGLLFKGEILVSVGRVNVLRIQVQDLVMRDDTRVGEVVDSSKSLLCHGKREWKHFGQDSHRVRNINDFLVLDNFRNEVSVNEVIPHGHTNAEDQAVGILLQHGFHV